MAVGQYLSLNFGCSEIINPLRTAAYVPNSQNDLYCNADGSSQFCGDKSQMKFFQMSVQCGCPMLQWADNGHDTPPAQIGTFTSPINDKAPWYDAKHPESAGFLGFIIEDVDGMNKFPGGRNVTPRATTAGGSTLGALRKTGRCWTTTVLAFGCSDCSLDYGFRWLTDKLTSTCSDDCTLCDAEVRTCCPSWAGAVPTYDEFDTGRWTLENVGVTEGPTEIDPPVETMRCNVRRYQFTMCSESPWAFKCPDPCIVDEPLWDAVDPCNVTEWICNTGEPKCCCIENKYTIGEDGMIVDVQARGEAVKNLTINIYEDPYGWRCNPATRPNGWVSPEPCAQIVVPELPEGWKFHYDTALEELTVTQPGNIVKDGSPYISTEPGIPPSFPRIKCGKFAVCIKADRCGYEGTESTFSIWSRHMETAV